MIWGENPLFSETPTWILCFSDFQSSTLGASLEDSQPWPSLGLPMFRGGGIAADKQLGWFWLKQGEWTTIASKKVWIYYGNYMSIIRIPILNQIFWCFMSVVFFKNSSNCIQTMQDNPTSAAAATPTQVVASSRSSPLIVWCCIACASMWQTQKSWHLMWLRQDFRGPWGCQLEKKTRLFW